MNYKHQIVLTPRDVLYFRDGRPIGGAADGNGAQWPLPTVWHSAVLSAFHRNFSEEDVGKYAKKHEHSRRGEKDKNFHQLKRTKAVFGGVKTLGPFPQMKGKDGKNEIYFPLPADLLPEEKEDPKNPSPAQLLPCKSELGCASNLPSPLKYVLWKAVKPTKQDLGQWISQEGLKLYLEGKIEMLEIGKHIRKNSDFFETEARPGIAINPETGTAEDSKFYSAEYLRLKTDVNMCAFIDADSVGKGNEHHDLWDEFCRNTLRQSLIFGGQRGVVWSRPPKAKEILIPEAKKHFSQISDGDKDKFLLKWTLLSPAFFNAGWIPGFCTERKNEEIIKDGKVRLKAIPVRGTLTRDEWRKKCTNAPKINAQLVAARIGKAITVSGWKINADEKLKNSGNDGSGAPKATRLLVHAGSVYYFECDSAEDAEKLYAALHGKVKSDLLGEQGYGLGVCSAWEFGKDL